MSEMQQKTIFAHMDLHQIKIENRVDSMSNTRSYESNLNFIASRLKTNYFT